MLGNGAYSKMATDLIHKVVLSSGHLQCDKGMIAGYAGESGDAVWFGAYKSDGVDDKGVAQMKTLYEGINSEKAVDCYVKVVGEFAAIGQAVTYFREKNATIEVQPG